MVFRFSRSITNHFATDQSAFLCTCALVPLGQILAAEELGVFLLQMSNRHWIVNVHRQHQRRFTYTFPWMWLPEERGRLIHYYKWEPQVSKRLRKLLWLDRAERDKAKILTRGSWILELVIPVLFCLPRKCTDEPACVDEVRILFVSGILQVMDTQWPQEC